MTAVTLERGGRTPWHLWLVGLVGLPWNGFGAYDYTMTNMRGEAYLRDFGMTDAQIAYFNSMPVWMTGVWAVGVWGALLGTLLLLLRRKLAVPVYAVSLAALVISLIYQFVLTEGGQIAGAQGMTMSAVILAGSVFFLLYSLWAARRGVLR